MANRCLFNLSKWTWPPARLSSLAVTGYGCHTLLPSLNQELACPCPKCLPCIISPFGLPDSFIYPLPFWPLQPPDLLASPHGSCSPHVAWLRVMFTLNPSQISLRLPMPFVYVTFPSTIPRVNHVLPFLFIFSFTHQLENETFDVALDNMKTEHSITWKAGAG